MNELTSLDYMKLLAWIAYYKCNVMLNKTQMQKILFMCYGQALACNDKPLFTDDTPKAWPFGPVFPRSYQRYTENIPSNLTEKEKSIYAEDVPTLKMIAGIVDRHCRKTATVLSDWSHEINGPWHKTVFNKNEGTKWNREIPQQYIKDYFSNPNWERNVGIYDF